MCYIPFLLILTSPPLQPLFLPPSLPSFLSSFLGFSSFSLSTPFSSFLLARYYTFLSLCDSLPDPCAAVFHVASERPDVGRKVEGSADSLTITSRRTKSSRKNEKEYERSETVAYVRYLVSNEAENFHGPTPFSQLRDNATSSPSLRWKFRGINRSLLPPLPIGREGKARATSSRTPVKLD